MVMLPRKTKHIHGRSAAPLLTAGPGNLYRLSSLPSSAQNVAMSGPFYVSPLTGGYEVMKHMLPVASVQRRVVISLAGA